MDPFIHFGTYNMNTCVKPQNVWKEFNYHRVNGVYSRSIRTVLGSPRADKPPIESKAATIHMGMMQCFSTRRPKAKLPRIDATLPTPVSTPLALDLKGQDVISCNHSWLSITVTEKPVVSELSLETVYLV